MVVVLVGCPKDRDEDAERRPIIHEEELVQPLEPPPPAPVADDAVVPDPDVPAAATPPADPHPACLDQATPVSFDPAKLRACFDGNGDGAPDRCVTWRRDGKLASIDTVFAVEDADAAEPPAPPVEYRSDTDHNDDERITLDGGSVEVCPYDRACLRFVPKIGDGEVTAVLTDPDYKRAVAVVRDGEGQHGTFEIWDLATGRLRARAAMKRLAADEAYDFAVHLGSGAFVALADDGNGRALGTAYGLDGTPRGELARGSRTLDVERTFRHAGVFGIVDIGPVDTDEAPYVVHLVSLATGGALGKLTIPRDADGDDDLAFHVLPNGFVAVTQWGEELRVDLIDLRTRTNRVLRAPGC